MAKSEIVDGLNIAYNGRSFPVWKYDEVPEGMRLAAYRDLWYGRQVLFQLQLGADAGKYFIGFFVEVSAYFRYTSEDAVSFI